MTPLKRRAAAVTAPFLLALTLTACGGAGADAPTDASVEDFCSTFTTATGAETPKDAADELAEVGTPEDIDDEAREGFEIMVDALDGAEDDASFDAVEGEVSEDDTAKVTAFVTYAGTTCADAITDGGTEDEPTDGAS
ncbi:hypothetical protein [Nocardioides sp. R-C-SC26]|uniref:hypothetical protein n=1 Tax=Nocardioides sp. R-C-SC26 TaxID=2870414 RepID=UPI001E288D24|nr:hypothetical protein [Nocardioides sp. R-C-SC26]